MAHTRKAQLFLVGIGFASFLAMNSFSLWGFSFLPQSVFGENAQAYWSTPLYVSNIVAFFGYFLGTTRFPHLFNRAPFVEAVLLMSAGMIFLLGYFLTWSLPMLSASGVLVGLGTTCCFISWEKVLSLSVLREAKKQIILGSVLSLLPFGLFFAFGQSGLLFTVSVLVFCNLVLLFVALRFRGDDPAELDPLEAPAAYRNVRGQFWKPLLCIIMIGIVSPVLGSVAFTGELAFLDNCVIVFSANLLSAAVLAIVWLALDRATTISKAYVVLFPVLITAFLLFPFVPERYRVLILFVGSFGFTLFSIVMMMSCISIAREKRISLVFVYSLFAGVTYVSPAHRRGACHPHRRKLAVTGDANRHERVRVAVRLLAGDVHPRAEEREREVVGGAARRRRRAAAGVRAAVAGARTVAAANRGARPARARLRRALHREKAVHLGEHRAHPHEEGVRPARRAQQAGNRRSRERTHRRPRGGCAVRQRAATRPPPPFP